MGVLDNMVHTESSRVTSLSNGSHSEERHVEVLPQNGRYAGPNGRLKFKRRRVSAVRDFPPGCGPSSTPFRLPSGQEVQVDTCVNGDKADDLRANGIVRSSEAEAVPSANDASENLVPAETVAQRDNLKFIDEKQILPSNDMNVGVSGATESHQVNRPEPVEVKSVDPIFTLEHTSMPEDSSEPTMLEPMEAQPLSMCLPDGEPGNIIYACRPPKDVGSASRQSIDSSKAVQTKYPPGRKVSAVRDFPPNMGRKLAPLHGEKIGKVAVSTKDMTQEKSGYEDAPMKTNDKQISSGTLNLTENMVRDIVVYVDQSLGREVSDRLLSKSTSGEDIGTSDFEKGNVAAPKPIGPADRRKAKKQVARHSPLKLSKKMNQEKGERPDMKNSERNSSFGKRTSSDTQLIVWDKDDSPDHDNISEDLEVVQQPREVDVGLLPSHPGGVSSLDGNRNKVKETLRLFHAVCRKLLQEEEAKPREGKTGMKRVDFQASKILRDKGKFVNSGKQIIGPVPGVEVGDEFQYRMELNMIGLHRPSQGGIDYVREGGQLYATSIVASGGYDDDLDNSDVLIYTGQGGNVMNGGKEPEDQKLERGNLALANSRQRRNPVRVIRGNPRAADSSEAKARAYVFDGLYLVEDFWQETGPHGKLVFKYKLQRIPGQPELSWKVVKKSKKSKFREGLCKLDISEGKERLPICAVNNIDDEKPPSFIYTVGMIYPDWCRPIPPKGCDCTTRCSESRKCSCVVKNGGGIPYNRDGAIVEAKSLVYECSPLCKCPPSCYNRVAQRGIKFQLEVFKTESRGWGVRSLNSIPSGSFICEYSGELLEDKEAERRTGNDEYLFDIGNNYDNSLQDEMRELMLEARSGSVQMVDESCGFTIDAARNGNVGRFINHSCSPNLYAQNVLFDHDDTRIPHVMFFAMDNIPPLQELTYHYNYNIGQVRDSNGNIKKKDCYCGSSECEGRLY